MEDLENGLDEKGLIDFVKTVLLSGNNPRGNEALENLKWGIKQYRKQLILHGVVVPKGTLKTKPECQLKDYDIWYKPCERCGYDTGKCPKTMPNKTCWQCGNRVKRDFTDRALKK